MSDTMNHQPETKAHWQNLDGNHNGSEPEEKSKSKYARKTFLKLMGASTAMLSLNCVRKPVEKIVPFVDAPENIKSGIANFYSSTCGGCTAACGLMIKTRDGRPIKLEGNPDHPRTLGAICANGQATILDLYDPERERNPKAQKSGKWTDIEWKALDEAVIAKIKEAPSKLRILTSPINSPSTKNLLNEFLTKVGGGKVYEFSATSVEESIALAGQASYGKAIVPDYRFDKANVILSIDADFMGTWISPMEFTKQFIKNRKLEGSTKEISKFIAVESIPTVTGTMADLKLSIKVGDQRRFALAIAKALGDLGNTVPDVVASLSVENLAKELGITKETIVKIATLLNSAKGKSLVVAGGTTTETGEAVDLQIAVNLINSILENEGKTIDSIHVRSTTAHTYFENLKNLQKELESGDVGVLIIHDLNPAYQLPSIKWKDLFSKATVVSYTDRLDETAVLANYLSASSHYLESWGDREPVAGSISIQQPVIRPLFNTRSFEDSLIAWAGGEIGGKKSFYEIVRSTHIEKLGSRQNWEEFLRKGIYPVVSTKIVATKEESKPDDDEEKVAKEIKVTDTKNAKTVKTAPPEKIEVAKPAVVVATTIATTMATSAMRSFDSASIKPLGAKEGAGKTKLALFMNLALLDGKGGNNSARHEMPDPVSKVVWDNFLSVSPLLATSLGIKSNDLVNVKVGNETLELPVQVQPGLNKETVGIALGYGRTNAGEIGNGVGKNTYKFIKADASGRLQFAGFDVSIEKTGKTYRLGCTQDFHSMNPGNPMGTTWKDRPMVVSASFNEWKEEPKPDERASYLPDPEFPTVVKDKNGKKILGRGFNPEHEYKEYKWHLSVDLNLCNGCGSCVIGCMVENNVPAVGRNEARVGREMHWIRIDRYYIGDANKPETMQIVHQPVMCQHCDSAPCETVCPVAATVHSTEGTNDMAYNRCVGTRYCANNCPYKVRRYNWKEHWKHSIKAPRHLAFNPNVTVRSRGVMEKCSFCAGRVAEAKFKAANAGHKVKDGELKSACQESCPTDAISFGSSLDQTSQVAQNIKNKRAYKLLEFVNVGPAVTYLARVRNTI